MTRKSLTLEAMKIQERLDLYESFAALRELREKVEGSRSFFPELSGNEVHALVNIAVALWVRKSGGEQPPPPTPECKTEAERTAYAFGWFKALETVQQQKEVTK